jgi:hypothetical protein
VIPLQFLTNFDRVTTIEKIDERKNINSRLYQLNKLEEERLIVIHNQEFQKQKQKAWNDHHLKKKEIKEGDLALLYDNRIKGKPKKLETTWLGPYVVEDI